MFNFLDSKNIGKDYKDFVLLRIDDLPDYKTKAVYLRHKKTGLEVYHVLKDDKENTFSFAFRTITDNSKGSAHVIEHSVLCGSEKYPLKEPFSTLASQSLYTFLNAITYPDKTAYPGSSLIRSDYFTMMDVYADAVFFPKLDYETFLQEGHRLELDESDNLSIQGVVYNEMKGNYSSFYSVAFSKLISTMFPSSFPAYDSGGDPVEIPELTYEEFLDYHKKFYNPDNCLLFLYGDIPTQDQLDFLSEKFIKRLEKKFEYKAVPEKITSPLPLIDSDIKKLLKIQKLEKSGRFVETAPVSGTTGSFVALCWYTGEDDISKTYVSEVLCGNDSSPLSSILKQSGLGDDITCFNFSQFIENFYIIGVYGVKSGNEEKVYEVFDKAIKDITTREISQKDIDGALMGLDVSLRDVNRYRGPYAIPVMEKVLKSWCYGQECSKRLFPITKFEELKKKVKTEKDYTQKLIKKLFTERPVSIEYICNPDRSYFEERREKETKLIQKLEANLDKEKLKKDLQKLHEYQQHMENSEVIQRTKISSLEKDFNVPHTKLITVEGNNNVKIPVAISEEETNGIFYLDVCFPYDRLSPCYFKHIPFLATIISNMGWNGKKWDECISQAAVTTGDIWGRYINGFVNNAAECKKQAEKYNDYNFIERQWLGITLQALRSEAEKSLELFSEIITTMDFKDTKRLKNLIKETVAERKSNIVQKGPDYAHIRNRALAGKKEALIEIQNGITQLKTVRFYKRKSPEKLLKLFEYIWKECTSSGAILHITSDKETLEKLNPLLSDFARKADIKPLLPKKEFTMEELKKEIYASKSITKNQIQMIKIPIQTSFTNFSTLSSDYCTKEGLSEVVLASWMENHVLWDKIRTTGGAYGTGCLSENPINRFSFNSYRDPNPIGSINIFKNIFTEIKDLDFSKDEMEKVILSLYASIICPVSPKGRGEQGFNDLIYAEPEDLRKKKFEMLLSLKPSDVKAAILRLEEAVKKEWYAVIFCDKSVKNSGNIIKIPL